MRIENVTNEQVLVSAKDFDPSKSIFNLETKTINNKPKKALWTSTMKDNLADTGWIEFFHFNETVHKEEYDCIYKVTPKDNTKVMIIETLDDYLSGSFMYNYELGHASKVLNYTEIAKDVDGIHFTDAAVCLGKMIFNHRIPRWVIDSLYCIDCESTVWFNTDWIKDFTYIGKVEDVKF